MDRAVPIWFEYATADLNTARFLLEKQYPPQLEIICYHCQQAAEKALKAMYLAAQLPGGIPRKHDLWFLLEQTKGSYQIPQDIWSAADALDPYSIIVRYPSENRVEESHARQAVRLADRLVQWAKEAVGSINMEETGQNPE